MSATIHFGEQAAAAGMFTPAANAAPSPAVLILPAVAGLNPYIAGVADELAMQGYASLSLDYYARSGGVPDLSDRAKIMAAVASFSDRQILEDIDAAIAYLKSQASIDSERIAVLGFCVGGTYAILAGSRFDNLRCAVSFYGSLKYDAVSDNRPLSPMDAIAQLRVPLLAHHGAEDPLIPLEHVRELREKTRNRPAEIYTYPGAGHAFHESFRPEVYRPIAAKEAWQRSLHYFDWYCKKESRASEESRPR